MRSMASGAGGGAMLRAAKYDAAAKVDINSISAPGLRRGARRRAVSAAAKLVGELREAARICPAWWRGRARRNTTQSSLQPGHARDIEHGVAQIADLACRARNSVIELAVPPPPHPPPPHLGIAKSTKGACDNSEITRRASTSARRLWRRLWADRNQSSDVRTRGVGAGQARYRPRV